VSLDASLEPRLDFAIIDQVRQLGAVRPGLLHRLVERFNDSAREFLDSAAREAGSEAASERLRLGFHSLKGSSASLGASRLSALAWEAELAFGAGVAPDALRACIDAARIEFDQAIESLRNYIRANC